VNVFGTINLLNYAITNQVESFVLSSSAAIYGTGFF
jgi:UDP-glucose 4-epimerase